jgi:hypothetical protein
MDGLAERHFHGEGSIKANVWEKNSNLLVNILCGHISFCAHF